MTATANWQELLARPLDGNHIAQIYQDEDFLIDALSHFVTTGLAQGDGLVVIATPEHWDACVRRLESGELPLRDAARHGQLVVLDAGKTLSRFMVDGMPDWKRFQDAVGTVINRTRRQYAKIRAFGEMADILWQRGERLAAIRLEQLWSHLVKVQDLALCCAYRIDNLDDTAYGALARVCEMHSHVIPARDYDRLEQTVNRASDDILGASLARMLHTLAAARQPPTHMPSAQATLLWLKEHMPLTASKILARVRVQQHERSASRIS